ncbi:hypothetical protein SFR_2878 [Streptomyces sp. FR-008]|nr:hypothetical protein SFR_2878 [Streptomyces sp. FR-008]
MVTAQNQPGMTSGSRSCDRRINPSEGGNLPILAALVSSYERKRSASSCFSMNT